MDEVVVDWQICESEPIRVHKELIAIWWYSGCHHYTHIFICSIIHIVQFAACSLPLKCYKSKYWSLWKQSFRALLYWWFNPTIWLLLVWVKFERSQAQCLLDRLFVQDQLFQEPVTRSKTWTVCFRFSFQKAITYSWQDIFRIDWFTSIDLNTLWHSYCFEYGNVNDVYAFMNKIVYASVWLRSCINSMC